jgi:hypothetical protein
MNDYNMLTLLLGRKPTIKEFLEFDFDEYNKTLNSRRPFITSTPES